MKILFLNPAGQIGGAEASLLEILASLREAEPSWPLMLVAGADGPLALRAAELGVRAEVVPFPRALSRLGESGVGSAGLKRAAFFWKACTAAPVSADYVRRLRRCLSEFTPDIVHTNGLKMHLLGVWSQTPGSAVVWHLHDYLGPRPFTARLLRRNARRCRVALANSLSVAAEARAVCAGRLQVHSIYNAVDLGRFSPRGAALDLDRLAGLPAAAPGVVRVGLVATFGRWKGHLAFLKALAMLPPDLPVRGYVVGGALYQTDASQYGEAELRAAASRLGLSGKVGFTGFVDDPAAAMRALDVVVHASTEPEPFGLVIAEAMACGRAVIASAAGGAAEIIQHGVDALGHPPGDVEALAGRIAELASNRALRETLGAAGRITAETLFTRDQLVRKLIPIYHAAASVN